MFRQIHDAMPDKGSITAAFTRPEEGRLVATVTPMFSEAEKGKQAVSLKPLAVAGTVEEFEVEFPGVLDSFASALAAFNTNLPDVLAEMEAKAGGKKDKKGKDKAPAAPEPPDRSKGEADEKLAATLAGLNGGKDLAGDPFQLGLRDANLATLEAALPRACGMLRKKILGREIAQIGGKELAEVLKPVLIADFKANRAAATNVALAEAVRRAAADTMDKIGKELARLTGKDLDALGLAPDRGQLIEEGAAAGDDTDNQEGA